MASTLLRLDNTSEQNQFRYIPPHAHEAQRARDTPLSSDHSGVDPPDPIPNSEVKRTRADGSVA